MKTKNKDGETPSNQALMQRISIQTVYEDDNIYFILSKGKVQEEESIGLSLGDMTELAKAVKEALERVRS